VPKMTKPHIGLQRKRMKLEGKLLLAVLAAGAFGLGAGCACPHRQAVTIHTVEVFEAGARADALLARETWRDQEGGGGVFLFADPTVQSMTAQHTNQRALGGGSWFAAGRLGVLVDSNVVPAIAAGGTAAGNVIGAAVKTAVK